MRMKCVRTVRGEMKSVDGQHGAIRPDGIEINVAERFSGPRTEVVNVSVESLQADRTHALPSGAD